MIVFVCTYAHRYTHEEVAEKIPAFRLMSYPILFARRRLPRATYIFSDFDRLGFFQLEVAAHVFRVLRDAGCRVLNDPAAVLQRLALLRQLYHAGINSFQAWAATDADTVDRFPVFVRTAAAHRGNLTGLVHDPAALRAEIAGLVAHGYPIANLIVVEYRGEPIEDDIFRKLAIHRIGDRMVAEPSVHERNWTAKFGQDAVASEAAYAEDLNRVRANPFAGIVLKAFSAANIDYGRADFGLAGGRPEIFEINTNPMVSPPATAKLALRQAAKDESRAAQLAAIVALDSPSAGPAIRIPPPTTMTTRNRKMRLVPGYQWTP